jgi:hypothetical protein
MNVIIIDRKAYSVSNKILKELEYRQELTNVGTYHEQQMNIMDLEFYIENIVVKKSKCLGFILFDYRN